jgi:PAS domain S-box-containing protein
MSHVVMEHIHHDQDGNAKHVEVHAHPIIEADGKVRQVAVYSVDVTMHVQVEEALRKSEDRYRSFLRNFRGIAYHGDMEWTPIFFHGAVEEITGYTEDDFITKKVTLDGVIHPDDWHHVLECDRKLHAISGYSEERFYRIIRKDGEIRWIRDIIENIRNGSGSYSLVQGVMYDITEQKRVEKEREQQRRELELYGSLLRHDLGNDLQIVIGYAEAIQVLSAGVDDEKAKMLGHVIAGAERMKQVLIAFGRLRPWRGNNIFTLMKQIAIQAEDVHEADHAGPRAIAEIVVSKEDVYAQVIVSDNGPGIPAKIRRNLFQKGTSTRGGGLGLYLTRQILKTYEGSIDLVESKDGKGAVFRIRLPLAT